MGSAGTHCSHLPSMYTGYRSVKLDEALHNFGTESDPEISAYSRCSWSLQRSRPAIPLWLVLSETRTTCHGWQAPSETAKRPQSHACISAAPIGRTKEHLVCNMITDTRGFHKRGRWMRSNQRFGSDWFATYRWSTWQVRAARRMPIFAIVLDLAYTCQPCY